MALTDKFTYSLIDKSGVFKLEILRSKLFWVGLLLKVILSFVFAGEFLKEAFIPFVTYFFESGFDNPYVIYHNTGSAEAFPYPPLMLFVLGFLGGFAADVSPFFIRIPLLIADVGILLVLSRLLKNKTIKLLKYYWLSPVLIYISYMHGQFDVIPIAFLIFAMYLLFKKRFTLAFVVLGLGIATKTNLLLALPLFLLYIWKEDNERRIKSLAVPTAILVLVFALFNLPFVNSPEYLDMVFNNAEQTKVWGANWTTVNNIAFYFIPAVYLMILAAASRFQKFSRDLFFMFIGFSFAALLIFIPPQPGWYFWIIPFLVYFNIKESKLTFLPVIALQAAFFLYFAVIPDSDYFFLYLHSSNSGSIYETIDTLNLADPSRVVNLSYTILQSCLILNVFWIYKAGIRKNINKRLHNKPFLIGIGGDSGVGKSTLTDLFKQLFGYDQVTVIQGDDMHRWERGHTKWDELTHLSPKANHLYEDIKQLKNLRTGKSIARRLYDHDTGKFTEAQKIKPERVVVFEGLHPFYIGAKRALFDLKIFIQPDEELRQFWKINRDMAKRGYTREQVIHQLELRKKDSEKYIQSQAPYSDIIINFYTINPIENDQTEPPEIGLKIEMETNIDLNKLVDAIQENSELQIDHQYEINHQSLTVTGQISPDLLENLLFQLLDNIDEIVEAPDFESDLNGFLQLFFIYCMLNKDLK